MISGQSLVRCFNSLHASPICLNYGSDHLWEKCEDFPQGDYFQKEQNKETRGVYDITFVLFMIRYSVQNFRNVLSWKME